MADYIDREQAIEAAYQGLKRPNEDPKWIDICENLKAVPSADVKPVVRCEECRHGYDDVGGMRCTYGVCVDCIVESDFYCAYGERGNDND